MESLATTNIDLIMACPWHTSELLVVHGDGLSCRTCDRFYPFVSVGTVKIPDFRTSANSGVRGERNDWTVDDDRSKQQITGESRDAAQDAESIGDIILDVGCGGRPRGTINIDCYVPNPIPQNLILADAELPLPILNKSIDKVVSYYSIEHVVSPSNLLHDFARVARKQIHVVTDNSDWTGEIIFRLLGRGRIFHDEHCYKWSVEYFANLINRLGYSNSRVYCSTLSNNPFVKLGACLGKIKKLSPLFHRDLEAVIELP